MNALLRLARTAAVAAASIAACGAVLAQSTTASLYGTVRSTDGRAVAGAVVQARSSDTGAIRTAVAGPEGVWRIDLLAPGAWTVVARPPEGVAGASRSVTLRLQQSLELDLAVGDAPTERVEVRAETPLVDTRRVGEELHVVGERADELPISGRVVTDLALLDSSVRATPPGNFYGERGSVFVINGQTGRSNSFLVDGLDNNDRTSGTTLSSFFSQQVIREFVVMTSQYAPEFGRASGGILNIVTRSGTNELSGEAFAQGTRPDWNSQGTFVGGLPGGEGKSVSRNGAGFRIGGPIKKDKAFYFVAFEHQSADEVTPFTGVERDGTAGGVVIAPNRSDDLFARFDVNLDASNFLMVRVSTDDRTTRDLNVGGVYTPEAGFRADEADVQLAASLTTVASPSVLNELRLLVGTSSFDQYANSDRPGVERPSGIFGGNNLNRQLRDEDRVQLVDNVTVRHGRHNVKFGADVTRSRTRVDALFNPNGNFLYRTDKPFEPGDCGDLLQSNFACPAGLTDAECLAYRKRLAREGVYCTGDPNGIDDDGDGVVDEKGYLDTYPLVFQLIEGHPKATLDDTVVGLFAQDDWRVSPRLTLDYGLRYDVSTFRLPESARVASSIPNGGAGPDRDNVAPRVGFTYTPRADGRLVVRGGAGMFYDKLVLAFPAVAAITSGTRIGLVFPQGLTLEITEDVVERYGIDVIKQGLIFPDDLTLRFSTGTTLDTPYTVQANVGVEGAVGKGGAWRANVIRALGYHYPLMRDLNPVIGSTAEEMPIHRDPTTGSIAAVVTEGRTWYTGLDLGWRWQGGVGWWSASYTWSKSLDLGPDPLKGGIAVPPNSDDIAGEKARSDYDRRHRIVLSGDTALPWGGFRASTVVQWASGAPFNVTTGLDENLDGLTNDRPNGVRRNTGEDTPLGPVNEIRDEVGLPHVTRLEEPALEQVDLRVYRPFGFAAGKGKGQWFLQVFNLFDRVNGGPIDGRASSINFGRAVGLVGPPRTLEVGLVLGF